MIDSKASVLSSDKNLLLERYYISCITLLIGNYSVQINVFVFLQRD